MIKSTKLERMAIEARLRDALAIKGNSDIEATLNTIVDYNNVEKIFLKLHQQYENLFICEYHNANTFAGQYKGVGAKHNLELERANFIKSFDELAELFSNVAEVQRQKRDTDVIIDRASGGDAYIIRSGANRGLWSYTGNLPIKPSTKHSVSSSVGVGSKPAQSYATVKRKPRRSIASSTSIDCLFCGASFVPDKSGTCCNNCFDKSLLLICDDCHGTFTPSNINQTTCTPCKVKVVVSKNVNLPKCKQCNMPFKRGAHAFLCDNCSTAASATPKAKSDSLFGRLLSLLIG